MGSGVTRKIVGSFYGTGSDLNVRTVGFRPSYVRILNVDGDADAEWIEGMADDSMRKVVTSGAGTTDISLVTSDGITPLSDGFSLGADSDLNVSDELVRYLAID